MDIRAANAPTTIRFSDDTHRAVIVSALAGLLSCLAVTFLLAHIVSIAVAPLCVRGRRNAQDGERVFLQKQLGVFVLCLLISDFIQSFSGMIQWRWVSQHGVSDGATCRAQAILLLAGDIGVCIWNAVVAVHTFMVIVLRRSMPNWGVALLVILGWLAVIIFTTIGPLVFETAAKGPYFGVTKQWCFITDAYADPRLWLHYIPIFISLFFIAILYTLVFFTVRGNIVTDAGGSLKIKHRWSRSSASDLSNTPHTTAALAKKMLWYPISYVFIVLPIAATRLAGLRGQTVPAGVSSFAITFLFLSGFINVTIYTATRKALNPVHWSKSLFTRGSHSRNTSRHTRSSGSTGSVTSPRAIPQPLSEDGTRPAIWITRMQETHYDDDVELQKSGVGPDGVEFDEYFPAGKPMTMPRDMEAQRIQFPERVRLPARQSVSFDVDSKTGH